MALTGQNGGVNGSDGHLPHLGLEQLGRAALGLRHGREHQVAEQLRVVLLEDGGIDRTERTVPRPSAVTCTRPPPADVSMVRLASSVCNCCSRPCICWPS